MLQDQFVTWVALSNIFAFVQSRKDSERSRNRSSLDTICSQGQCVTCHPLLSEDGNTSAVQ